MPTIRSAVALAAAVAGAAAGTVLAAAPASAATAPCPAGYYCFYQDANYNRGTTGWHLNYNSTQSGDFNNPPASSGNKRNQLSSIINNGNRTICVYNDVVLAPDKLLIKVPPYGDVPNLANIPGANDNADYWKLNAC
ncbi:MULTISPECIES: peptidase inhibitor family I36 protein [Amycolatopsis]|uniref:peptidase inhibitor family I36 protein n=1 Tax=Amycolatopsis TaxID=1813 RepID=UPI0005699E56|nr:MULTISPECIES: peptidase inhibitor family I36 protein [Amycolatopsis]MCG3754752.1 peptidase inhibitor family I36 protein [Amycolatopsis sp. Poz14]